MRSQKQNNRTPRPFKNKSSDRPWAGGKKKDVPPPTLKAPPKAKEPEPPEPQP